MSPTLTIAYPTSRAAPRFEWFANGLVREARTTPGFSWDHCQVLVVDGRLWTDPEARRGEIEAIVAGRFEVQHVPPKPTVWQGPHRLTKRDYFCAANARNTALALARNEHVVFVDDLSVLLPGWLSAHLHAAEHHYVLCGLINKQLSLRVDGDGLLTSYHPYPAGVDTRLAQLPAEGGPQPCAGGWLYGGTFSVPLEAALAVNGLDEIHDGLGAEDYDFGLRLERAGWPIRINRDCGAVESEDLHLGQAPARRLDKPVAGPDGPRSSNLLLRRLLASDRSWTVGNRFVLRDLRAAALAGAPFPEPTEPDRHWLDGMPLAEHDELDELLSTVTMLIPTMDGWCSPEKARAMARLVVETGAEVSVEIGVFGGRSLLASALAHAHAGRGRAYGIDPWAAGPALADMQEPENLHWWANVDYEAIYRRCLEHVLEQDLSRWCSIHRTTSARALFLIDRVDILHVDGNHAEEQALFDVRAWLAHVPPGGHIWLDDVDWPSVARALAYLDERCDRMARIDNCLLFRARP